MDKWEVRKGGIVCARSSLKYLGYVKLTIKMLRDAGFEIFKNGKAVN